MSLRSHAWAAALYALLTVLMTWPLGSRLHLIEAGDSSYFAWVMSWTMRALLDDPLTLPHANTLHPLRYALFLDEPIVGTSLLSLPIRLVTTDPIVTLNVVRLLTFFLTALGVRALALSLGLSPLSAFAAGALFSFSSNRVSSPAHLSVLGTQFLPLYLLFLHRWARTGSGAAAALAGFFFGVSAWSCGYHALLAAAILPIPVLVLLERRTFLKTAPLGIAIAIAFLLPLRWLHQQALEPLGYERTASETAFFSAPLEELRQALVACLGYAAMYSVVYFWNWDVGANAGGELALRISYMVFIAVGVGHLAREEHTRAQQIGEIERLHTQNQRECDRQRG